MYTVIDCVWYTVIDCVTVSNVEFHCRKNAGMFFRGDRDNLHRIYTISYEYVSLSLFIN